MRTKIHKKRGKKPQLYSAFGIEMSIPQWAAELDMSEDTIRNRLKKGHTFEEAISPYKRITITPNKNSIFYTYEGETKNLYRWAQEYDLSYQAVIKRYKRGDRGKRLFRAQRVYTKTTQVKEKPVKNDNPDFTPSEVDSSFDVKKLYARNIEE